MPRPNPYKTSPTGYEAINVLDSHANGVALEASLVELARLRASQLNGCAYCIGLHAKGAVEAGVPDEKVHLVAGWRLSDEFSERERAALAWAEAVTLVAEDKVPDAVYAEVSRHLSESEIVDLAYVLVAINAWNRLQVAFRQ